ncbi:hypothetical protein CVV65_12660 [Kyrpidia spormannii]|uniref:Uncharacterized protein n=2 Tax=Kyrpidia spormannii TaxID=2055160 RepID=A0ACA8ZC22_9BACL|nr:hypothetical protein [Kyrpidia spormannii]ATY85674.1 hypothetical protein CVV65_12660 [Kyrpidia spormannii]CAB3394215.1 conserved protein of unknown function [Kyrpidia spormannii]
MKWFLTLLIPPLAAALLTGCAERAKELREQAIPSQPRILNDSPNLSRVPHDNRGVYGDPRSGLLSARAVADQLNRLPGIRGAVVLLQGRNAYVGFHQIGPDDSPEAKRIAREGLDPTRPVIPPRGADTGKLDHPTAARVEKIVRQALPEVKVVRITTVTSSVAELQGYAAYIEDGGNPARFVGRFQQSVSRIWKTGG